MTSPWRTVGLHAPSSSSPATCAQRVEECQKLAVTKQALYEPSPTPCLYVANAKNMVGRIPLIPCFLDGNATPTMPHKYSKNKSACFPAGCADSAAEDGRRGSNVYEVNTWLWQFA